MITSSSNSKFKMLKQLLTSKGRKELSMFIAEGKRFVKMNPKEVFSLSDEYTCLDKKLFDEISTLENSEGYISVFELKKYELDDMPDMVVVSDKIQNPENIGAIARNSDAFGFKGLILMKGSCDPFNPKAVRASMGSIIHLKVCYLDEYLDLVNKYTLVAADINGGNLNDSNFLNNIKDNKKIALILGNESAGVSSELLEISNTVRIPMIKNVDSLNVAVASGIMMYLIFTNNK